MNRRETAPADAVALPTFERLYEENVQQVARWASRLAGPRLEIEDVVQEVFLIAHRRLSSFRGQSRLSTWLFGITQNVVRHRRRKERLRRLLMVALPVAEGDSRPQITPVEELERRQASTTVYRLLDGMADKYRTIFILTELEQMSTSEIAAITGMNTTTVRVRLHRARLQFLSRLATEEAAMVSARERAASLESAGLTRPRLRSAGRPGIEGLEGPEGLERLEGMEDGK